MFAMTKRRFTERDGVCTAVIERGPANAVQEAWAYGKPVLMTLECNLPKVCGRCRGKKSTRQLTESQKGCKVD